jgi:hypothetical protein
VYARVRWVGDSGEDELLYCCGAGWLRVRVPIDLSAAAVLGKSPLVKL